ncbi:MAG: VRR-NUC domain-containing protein [Saccharospirillum sp.]|nr:VRR-NUC domain-containing protein [Saccharospirillum sp.]
MTVAPPSDLPVGYYLDNFRTLLATVSARYDDLLTESERQFIADFDRLETAPARLLVRFYTRKGPRFRLSKLRYSEIPDIDTALQVLSERGMVDLSPLVSAEELASSLTLPELRQLDWVTDKKASKARLLAELTERQERLSAADWGVADTLIEPLHWSQLRCLQLLYFGNEQQSLTDFVLADLGLFRYESYSLSKASRAYQQRIEVEQHLYLNDLRAEADVAELAGDSEGLLNVAERLLSIEWYPAAARRYQRLSNRIGYRLEQWQEWPMALRLFNSHNQPPARERQCRIRYKQNEFEACWDLLQQIKADPGDSSEARFYSRFQPRVARKLRQPVHSDTSLPIKESRHSLPRGDLCVELLVCEQLDQACWLENLLPLGIFGLIHWPTVFADTPGAFHHPFQQGPSDLYHPDFLNRRHTSREQLKQQLTPEIARQRLTDTWHAKEGLMNPFVHWPALELPWLLRCFDRVPWAHWCTIFDHLWRDLKRHRSGFPDLFQLTDTGYRWIEIKGPGDRLQDNQRDWLQRFASAGIPAEVWYIDYL